ncbi:MAG TPA: hypothetical protein VEI53_05340 [Ktedonobacteraceae bacterium]|nr:hypothetical protein [Ktedonobacteraceae bacterium]
MSAIEPEPDGLPLDNDGLIQSLIHCYDVLSKRKLSYSIRLIDLLIAIPTIIIIWRFYGLLKAVRYMIGLSLALMTQRVFISAMIHLIGTERSSLADALTLSRGANGAVLAGLVTSGIRDRKGIAGWIGWLMPAPSSINIQSKSAMTINPRPNFVLGERVRNQFPNSFGGTLFGGDEGF